MEVQPIDPAAVDMAVLGAYGATMLAVQAFERNLAVLVLALESKPSRNKPFKSDEQFRAHLLKLVSRLVDAFQRASAKALRKRLPEDFDPELLTEIKTLIAWRDRLAHRYLVENLTDGQSSRFKPDAFIELWQLSTHFQATTLKLHKRMLTRLAELPESDAPEPVRDVFTGIARTIMLGKDWKPPGEPGEG